MTRATAPDLLRRPLAAMPERARASGRVAMRADAGYFAGQLARAAHDARIAFAISARRITPLWRLLIRRVALDPAQVAADPRSRRRRTLHPDQRARPFDELAGAGAIYAYSFILTNLGGSSPDKAAAEHWHRHRITRRDHGRVAAPGHLHHRRGGHPGRHGERGGKAMMATLRGG